MTGNAFKITLQRRNQYAATHELANGSQRSYTID